MAITEQACKNIARLVQEVIVPVSLSSGGSYEDGLNISVPNKLTGGSTEMYTMVYRFTQLKHKNIYEPRQRFHICTYKKFFEVARHSTEALQHLNPKKNSPQYSDGTFVLSDTIDAYLNYQTDKMAFMRNLDFVNDFESAVFQASLELQEYDDFTIDSIIAMYYIKDMIPEDTCLLLEFRVADEYCKPYFDEDFILMAGRQMYGGEVL